MKIAIISATKVSINPIENAFHEVAPHIDLIHIMDTGLLPMMEKAGELTPDIIRRFSLLLNMAEESEVDLVQLTCSAFNNVTSILQPLYNVKLFRSDEAMLDKALTYQKIGMISTVKETPPALISYMKEKKPEVQVTSKVGDGVIHLLAEGKKEEHDRQVLSMIEEFEGEVDVIVLSQYSMAHIAEMTNSSVPILTAPKAAAQRCLEFLENLK